ncbi:hypothetical protein X765_04270 [Mesorhizobium sp. LSHC440B00]|nr:hypothetical protein X765_04270 [Mesorhizobium sp. LSHC440B00]ESX40040.1 hypothetical protein X763_04155 [Mesorhizobium sp. LSHC432A00]ESX44931.1 hypothetical protein X764_03165 [Mesorhizobium sp. LSHC440A00]ESX79943.1 hypothetical protein X757_01130 [Mesorhizobium sp. LSHC414A00]
MAVCASLAQDKNYILATTGMGPTMLGIEETFR